MTEHLSQEQFSRWTAGERDRKIEQHLRSCEACRSEMTAFESALGEFREAVREWSDSEYRPARFHAPERLSFGWSGTGSYRWLHSAAIAVALCLILFFIRGRIEHTSIVHVQPESQSASISDAALWHEIDQETSETVSPALAPLEESSVRSRAVSSGSSLRR